uniref:insulinase family protein n=1 Tax=Eubacterium sp. TaxID=142586 RepID=UPI004025D0AB
AVVGNVDPERVVKICDEMLEKSEDVTIERVFDTEPREIVKPYEEYHLAVSMPVFSFGYKEACKTPQRTIKETVEMDILLEILAGETSDLYGNLFEKGLINSNFSKEYFTGNGYEAVIFEGESTDA